MKMGKMVDDISLDIIRDNLGKGKRRYTGGGTEVKNFSPGGSGFLKKIMVEYF